MDNKQKVENKKEIKTQKTPKEKKAKVLNGCEVIRRVGMGGYVKDTKEHAEKALQLLKNAGVTKNKNGKEITIEGIKSQITSINGLIGKTTQKHWAKFKMVAKADGSYKYELA